MMRHLILLLCTLSIRHATPAQTVQQWLRWGDAALAVNDHASACRYYEGALDAAPGRMSIQWSLANAYRNDRQYARAAALYERVFFKDQGRTYPDALHWLAEMQLCSNATADARGTWQRVRSTTRDPVVLERADNALLGIALAERMAQRPDSVLLISLPPSINSPASEFAPRVGPDSALYFTALRYPASPSGEVTDTLQYRTRIYRSARMGQDWAAPAQYLPDAWRGDVANGTWSLDGQRLYFSHCPRPDSCTIMVAERKDEHWQTHPLEGLGEGTATQPGVMHWDGREMLLFVSDRPGGVGGTDIWQARLDQGRALELQPLTGAVNTVGNERCPWYDARRNELWFSSDHLPGLGGYDVFVARYENDVFSTPINPGTPFNSPQNDLYPYIDPGTGDGWLSSDRGINKKEGNDRCCSDIYRWMPPAPTHTDSSSLAANTPTHAVQALLRLRESLPLSLYFRNDEPGPRTTERSTTLTYAQTLDSYRAQLPEHLRRTSDTAAFRTFWNDHVLRGEHDLQRLVTAVFPVLEQGRSIVLEVRGHASPLAFNDYNARLSERRIASLRNELGTALNGALLPYLTGTSANSARLELRTLPFGEEEADQTVSDRLEDLTRSVYSVGAARERRIDVLSIDVAEQVEHADGVLRLVKELGDVRQNKPQRITFRVPNTSDRPLKLVDSNVDCGCTTAVLPSTAIGPGSAVELVIDFSGQAPQGPLSRHVRITTDGIPKLVELTITGTVVP
ncbi:MAG: DUF1573 domain-containing protein [Flavobacteriales bacterium]